MDPGCVVLHLWKRRHTPEELLFTLVYYEQISSYLPEEECVKLGSTNVMQGEQDKSENRKDT